MPEFPEKARLSAGRRFAHFGIGTYLNGHLNGLLRHERPIAIYGQTTVTETRANLGVSRENWLLTTTTNSPGPRI